MTLRVVLAGLMLLASGMGALAQSTSPESQWGKSSDLKPMVPVLPRVFIPPNSSITSGPASSGYSSAPLYDPTRDQATPGLRLTIPSR